MRTRLLRAFDSEPTERLALDLLEMGPEPRDRGRVLAWLCDVERWDEATPEARQRLARHLAASTPGLVFDRLAQHAWGAQRHCVALFSFAATSFALIPGGRIQLGADGTLDAFAARFADRPLDACDATTGRTPRQEIAELWDKWLSRSRVVCIAPLLVEVAPTKRGYDYIDDDVFAEDYFGAIEAGVAREGMRLLTPDEWEHAYAAGARTLFPWGDARPSADEWQRRREGRNAFGLSFPDAFPEVTSVYRVFKGNDGGCLSCGGSPYADLTDASSYVFSLDVLWADQAPDAGLECTYYGSECTIRRALPMA